MIYYTSIRTFIHGVRMVWGCFWENIGLSSSPEVSSTFIDCQNQCNPGVCFHRECPKVMTSEASNCRMEVFQRFRCDVLLWFVCGLVMQSWFWHGFRNDFDMGQKCEQNLKTYQNHINIASKSHQNRSKTISKSYQNISTPKNLGEIDQKPAPAFILFPFFKPTHRNLQKIISKSYQNRIKPYQNHIPNHICQIQTITKTRSKRYQNHIEIITSHSKRIELIS